MSAQSTVVITRSEAIDRILMVHALATEYEYRELEKITYETDADICDFIDNYSVNIEHLSKWTNKMLIICMDKPFFRKSKLENYIVIEDDE